MGRADGQVKIRGYRVELTEIESALAQCHGVAAAACAVREDVPGLPHLVAWVVSANGPVDELRLRSELGSRLPGYMIPSRVESIGELPRLVSGKLDRAALPAPRPAAPPRARGLRTHRHGARHRQRLGAAVPSTAAVARRRLLLRPGRPLAARRACRLGASAPTPGSPGCRWRTSTAIAPSRRWQPRSTRRAMPGHRAPRDPRRRPRPSETAAEARRHFLTGTLQSLSLYFVLGVHALRWVTPYFVFFLLAGAGYSALAAAAWAVVSVVAVTPATMLGAIAAKWLLLGRVRPGRHRLWGGYHLRWWFAHSMVGGMMLDHLAGTPLLPILMRLLGARVGRNVYLGTHHIAAFDIVSIGDGASVDDGATLLGSTVENGELIIAPVSIGRDCYVGARAVMREGTTLEDGARLEDLSLLPRGSRIPAGETWAGSPARPVAAAPPPAPPPERGAMHRAAVALLYGLLVLLLPLVPVAAIVPGMGLLMRIGIEHPWRFLAAAPVVGGSFVLLLALEVVALKWLLVGRVRAGTYPLHGGFYVRNWTVEQLMAFSLQVVAPIYATLHVVPWYRALGAKLGRLVEVSTASFTPPDLLEIADGGTIADDASVGEPRVERGWLTVARTRIGRRAFVGNSGVLPTGVELGDDALVGVLSTAPTTPGAAARAGSAWLGSPPLELPRRETSAGFIETRTYAPPTWLILTRGTVELLRVTLPPSGFILVSAAVVTATLNLWMSRGALAALLLMPVVYAACCAAVLLVTALAKWTLIGRYRPFVCPLWSPFVWRLELVNALYEFLATPLALGVLQGTPLLPWYLRLLGAKVGRRVYTETTGFLEWDLVELGDRAVLNEDCVLQTHLFEDRMLKASRLRVGADCSVGAMSVVLYDSQMQDRSSLDALSLLMKGETLRAGTSWRGIPPLPAEAQPRGPGARPLSRFALGRRPASASPRADRGIPFILRYPMSYGPADAGAHRPLPHSGASTHDSRCRARNGGRRTARHRRAARQRPHPGLERDPLQDRSLGQEHPREGAVDERGDDPSRRRGVRARPRRLRGDALHPRGRGAPRVRPGPRAQGGQRRGRFHLHRARRPARGLQPERDGAGRRGGGALGRQRVGTHRRLSEPAAPGGHLRGRMTTTGPRETFATRFGTVMTMIGVAVGLGNVWRFPYMVGKFGGAAFVLFYVAVAVAIGVPALMAEYALGRQTRRGTVGAFAAGGFPFGRQVGWFFFCVVVAATGYYSAVIGWVLYYALGQGARALGAGVRCLADPAARPWLRGPIVPAAAGLHRGGDPGLRPSCCCRGCAPASSGRARSSCRRCS
jgi:non-ribosomal peptide synthetase-like protein